ncbi:hypothetical protein F4780DRAFT_790035 [Xylariomycetidae sp. FL0641]|nr:hypothetical protein F4780DRAFT_790035 [Xylariomycetidae sp. FL0641]
MASRAPRSRRMQERGKQGAAQTHGDERLGPKPKGHTVLVRAGASSVGTNAIHLAVASGYEVIATASPKDFEYCEKLWASQIFDWRAEARALTQQLITSLERKTCAGGFAVHSGSEGIVFEAVGQSSGSKFVACAVSAPATKLEEVQAKTVFASSIKDNEVADAIYSDYLPKALAEGKLSSSACWNLLWSPTAWSACKRQMIRA